MTVTAAAVAAACRGRLVGDPALPLHGVRALEAAGPSELSFAAGRSDEKKAISSRAGALLAQSAAGHEGRTVIEVENPALAIAAALALFHPPRAVRPGAHPTAVVGEGARVDPSAELGPYVVVGARARIGPRVLVE